MNEINLDRRNFLRGSALFAAALGLAVVPARAQEPQQQQKPADPFAKPDDKNDNGPKTYTDKEGREYRICPQCAYNMYKQGRMWVCENCGYSYVE